MISLHSALDRFSSWLDAYGETSFDHQSYFAGPIGGRAKALYYRRPRLGTLAVLPMIFSEAVVPAGRRLFWRKQRFPIADAHYAMGYAYLYMVTRDREHYERAVHFLEVLCKTRSPDYERAGWGYPFDWVTRNGTMTRDTPLITTTPYVYEAFSLVHDIDNDPRWLEMMRSSAEHAAVDIKEVAAAPGSASAGYNPSDSEGGVVNASAYRAFMLTSAAQRFSRDDYREMAERNLRFVLDAQNADGSWFYSVDGVRDFVDHFHTCFVLKALAKIEALTGDPRCTAAIEKGVRFYAAHLFDSNGLPKPFSRAPRLTVYRQELYDYAECINLGVLLRGRFEALDAVVASTLDDLLKNWQRGNGAFRARRLLFGWDNVPMHRWAQAQLFRSLAALAATLSERTLAAREER